MPARELVLLTGFGVVHAAATVLLAEGVRRGRAAEAGLLGTLETQRACVQVALAPRAGAGLDDVRHRPLAPRRGAVQAQCVPADVDAVEAVAGADAGPDALLLAPHHLRGDVRGAWLVLMSRFLNVTWRSRKGWRRCGYRLWLRAWVWVMLGGSRDWLPAS